MFDIHTKYNKEKHLKPTKPLPFNLSASRIERKYLK